MKTPRELKVIELHGTPWERGCEHGEKLKHDIQSLVVVYRAYCQQVLNLDLDLAVTQFLDHSQFLETAEKWTPDLLEETRGIAETSGIPFKFLFTFQNYDEFNWFNYLQLLHGMGLCHPLYDQKRGNHKTESPAYRLPHIKNTSISVIIILILILHAWKI